MATTRRSFLAGLGSVSVGLLFSRRLDAVLQSLERDLVSEPQVSGQEPSAADVMIRPQSAFSADRLVMEGAVASQFVIENIFVGTAPQLSQVSPVPAELFSVCSVGAPRIKLDRAEPGEEVKFRVRYVGRDPAGARFRAMLVGYCADGSRRVVIPVDSGYPVVS